MRAVVTGGAGFLGSHLCDRLLAEGWEVLALDNLITGSESNVAHLSGNAKFRYEKKDVSEPLRVAGEVGYVFHFASPASPPDYLKFPIETLKVGSIATMHTLDLALEKKAKGSDKEAKEAKDTLDLVNRALALLRAGKPARLTERKKPGSTQPSTSGR